MAFEFEDSRTSRIYKRLTNNFSDGDAVDYFERRTHQFDGDINSLPVGVELKLDEVSCFDSFSLTDSKRLRGSLYSLVKMAKNLNRETRERYLSSIDKLIRTATFESNTIASHWLAEQPLQLNSRLFDSCKVSLNLVGGHLIRVFVDLSPSRLLKQWISKLSSNQIPTRLKLWRTLSLGKEEYANKVIYGNDEKLKLLNHFNAVISAEVERLFVKSLHTGIFRQSFGGIPKLLVFSCDDHRMKGLPASSAVDNSNFFRLLAQSGGSPNYSLFETPGNDQLIDNCMRNSPSLALTAKLLKAAGCVHLSNHQILTIVSEKEAMRLLLFRLNELKIRYVRVALDKAIEDLKGQRLDLYRLSTVFEVFSGGFEKEQRTFLGSMINNDNLIRLNVGGSNGSLSFSKSAQNEITFMRKQIRAEISSLSRGYSILRDEANSRFQSRIQVLAILLSLLLIPPVQIAWDKLVDCFLDSQHHSQIMKWLIDQWQDFIP